MPPIPQRETSDAFAKEARRRDAEGVFKLGFRRSKRGNLWSKYDGATFTVFPASGGGYSWCIHDGQQVRYSAEVFDYEADALESLTSVVL